jgi:hypothetical protein
MRLRVRTDLWATSLFAALGLLPLAACGGRADGGDDSSSGGSTGGQPTGSGGSVTPRGGSVGSGGTGIFPVAGNQFPCENPIAIEASPGFVTCDNGMTARQSAQTCPSPLPRPEPAPNSAPDAGECQYDTDCTAAPNGYCVGYEYDGAVPGAYCSYGCTNDAECGAGFLCECGDPVGYCVPTQCHSEADCSPGFHCASYDSGGCGTEGYACQQAQDACATLVDCPEVCTLDYATQSRVCGTITCYEGRPFLVDDLARVAPTVTRSDWLTPELAPQLDGMAPELRQRLCEEWRRAAQYEHASVAAFSRFLMELLAFGAPSELVAETVTAIEDERRHAQICFTIASAFAGVAVGPGALDVQGALETPTLARSLATTVREGCIGETVAALSASELAAHVADPVLLQVLEGIAADERRHAELAWKFAHWALCARPELVSVLENELALVTAELAAHAPLDAEPGEPELARAGVMPSSLRRAVREAGLRQIVAPGLAGMIEFARREASAAA